MSIDNDDKRIAAKAHELWEAEGHPHGRDRAHWEQAREIIALKDSAGDTLLPRETGATDPIEERTVAIDNEGEAPGLTDTGEHDLTSTAREPAVTAPRKAAAKKVSTADASKSEAVKAKAKAKAKGAAKAR